MCGLFYTNDSKYSNTHLLYKNSGLISHRGPDNNSQLAIDNHYFSFHRLSIIDTSENGHQPFLDEKNKIVLMCNGEIYNSDLLRKTVNYDFKSKSDCEVIIPLYLNLGFEEMLKSLDGEFAIILYDIEKNLTYFARDEIGIRPMFIGEKISYTKLNKTKKKRNKRFYLSSEAKSLHSLCDKIKQVKPGHYFCIKENNIIKEEYNVLWKNNKRLHNSINDINRNIKNLLVSAVEKRLNADVPVGFLLSGGLDSSLVCSIAARKSNKQIKTFSVGIEKDPIDTKYAREVANYIGSDHHEFLFKKEDVINHLEELIYSLETWDITTVRASIGMSLLCKYIKEKTDCKVILTGEVSDELFGYKYTDYAPSSTAFQRESEKRIRELCYFDVLRADRCISKYGLEARVPFSDKSFVKYVMNINPNIKMNKTGIGKYLLRKSFEENDYLPKSILYREKAAFSDAVGHSMVNYLIEYAETVVSDEDLTNSKEIFKTNPPFTKESFLYRKIFNEFYPGRANLIPSFWMPNKSWKNCDVKDPSARVLPNYGESGS